MTLVDELIEELENLPDNDELVDDPDEFTDSDGVPLAIKWYDNSRLVNAKDEDGDRPQLFFSVSDERGPGKTFSFVKMFWQMFFNDGHKFGLIVRQSGRLGSVAHGMFKPYFRKFLPGAFLWEKTKQKGVYSEIWATIPGEGDEPSYDKHCGYVLPLNLADKVKMASGEFTDIHHLLFDEFQPRKSSSYLPTEVQDLVDIIESLDRGEDGVRYVPVYLVSNSNSKVNPYYIHFGMVHRIRDDSKFVRGCSWVYQKVVNKQIQEMRINSPLGKLMKRAGSHYEDSSYSGDSNAGISKPDPAWGKSTYLGTIWVGDQAYAIRTFDECGIMYIDRRIDSTCTQTFRVTKEDDPTRKLLRSTRAGQWVRHYTAEGRVRYNDLITKAMAMEYLL